MSTQHTPGPWYVSKRNPLRVIESGMRGNAIARCGLNLGVCAQTEAEANARLIAAAPELLDALEKIANAAPYDDGYNAVNAAARFQEIALAAIAKATS